MDMALCAGTATLSTHVPKAQEEVQQPNVVPGQHQEAETDRVIGLKATLHRVGPDPMVPKGQRMGVLVCVLANQEAAENCPGRLLAGASFQQRSGP